LNFDHSTSNSSIPLIHHSSFILHPFSRRAFTLVEILMVLAILGISTIVAMPSLVKSIRGNRLRVGARTVVMAGNYARTMAILRNQEMTLTLDKGANTVAVAPLHAVPPPLPSDLGFQDSPPPPDPTSPAGANEPVSSPPPPVTLTRKLDSVSIDSIQVEHRKSGIEEDSAVVIYQNNGRCNPYEVRVRDEFGSVMVITVDAVASPKLRKEGE
jgi:prepilin-type N-terminal cleavage/methylation domain-containing protein